MSVRTRSNDSGRVARRVQAAQQVKSGAAQRAYDRKRTRASGRAGSRQLPVRSETTVAGRIPFVAAILVMFGCGLILTLVLTTLAAQDSYQLSDAREANQTLTDERAALRRQVAAADSAPELAARARELGMIPAEDPARLVVAPDGNVTVVGEPEPAQGAPAPPLNKDPNVPGPNSRGAGQVERIVPVNTAPRQETSRDNERDANVPRRSHGEQTGRSGDTRAESSEPHGGVAPGNVPSEEATRALESQPAAALRQPANSRAESDVPSDDLTAPAESGPVGAATVPAAEQPIPVDAVPSPALAGIDPGRVGAGGPTPDEVTR